MSPRRKYEVDDVLLLREFISQAMSLRPDALVGHGYGSVGKSKYSGALTVSGGDYPYKVRADESENDEADDEKLLRRIRDKTRLPARYRDQTRRDSGGPNFAYVDGATRLGESSYVYQQIYTSMPRSSRPGWGSKYGWFYWAPLDDDRDGEILDLKDVSDRANNITLRDKRSNFSKKLSTNNS